MNKSWFDLGAISSLAILITSCGDSKPAVTPAPSPTVASSTAAVPATVPAVPTATPTPTVAASTPTVPGKKPALSEVSVGLIAPTDGDNWAKTVSKGRVDPFATLVLQPIEVAEKDPLDGTGKPQRASSSTATNNSPAIKSGVNKPLPAIKIAAISGKIFTVSSKSKTANKRANSAVTGITRDRNSSISAVPISGVNKALPKVIVDIKANKPSKSPIIAKIGKQNVLRPVNVQSTSEVTKVAIKPERVVEKPLQAMALEISGVIEVEGQTQIIVKLPNESFSRYIEVGNRIANGQVLVKRVEDQNSLSPTVVLEEVGVEVSRKIGDKSTASNSEIQSKP
jgi:hypothetical protein